MTGNELLLSISNMMDYKLEPVNRNIQRIKDDITDIKTRVKKIELTQETQILPRLNTIEACYIINIRAIQGQCRNI